MVQCFGHFWTNEGGKKMFLKKDYRSMKIEYLKGRKTLIIQGNQIILVGAFKKEIKEGDKFREIFGASKRFVLSGDCNVKSLFTEKKNGDVDKILGYEVTEVKRRGSVKMDSAGK
jgi:hypothetical protein